MRRERGEKRREKGRGGEVTRSEEATRLDQRPPTWVGLISSIPHFSESPYCHLRGNCVVLQHGDPVPATW